MVILKFTYELLGFRKHKSQQLCYHLWLTLHIEVRFVLGTSYKRSIGSSLEWVKLRSFVKWVWYLTQGGWCEVEEGHGGCQTLSPQQPVKRPPLALSGMGLHLDVTFSENTKGSYKWASLYRTFPQHTPIINKTHNRNICFNGTGLFAFQNMMGRAVFWLVWICAAECPGEYQRRLGT